MDTKNFNIIDKIIAKMRLAKVSRYIRKKDIILDFGCGASATLLQTLSDKFAKGYGLDYEVKNIITTNLELRKFKFKSRLPYPDKKFSLMFMLAVLEHIDLNRIDLLFNEFHRVLKTNGRLLLTTPTPMSKPVLELLAWMGIISKGEINDHKKYYCKDDIIYLANKYGFKLVSYNYFQFGLNSYAVLKKNSNYHK